MTPGSKWRHFEGNEYMLLGCCRLDATMEPHVVYKLWDGTGTNYGAWWCRPLVEWDQEVAPGVKRFVEVQP